MRLSHNLSILIILLGVALFYIPVANGASEICYDSDGGQEFFILGTNTDEEHQEKIFTDFCTDDDRLTEYFCDGNRLTSYLEYCEYGCEEGVCRIYPFENTDLQASSSMNCLDSDEGKIFFDKGHILIDGKTNDLEVDFCVDVNHLMEFYCENGNKFSTLYNCSYGCKLGQCQEDPSVISSNNIKIELDTVVLELDQFPSSYDYTGLKYDELDVISINYNLPLSISRMTQTFHTAVYGDDGKYYTQYPLILSLYLYDNQTKAEQVFDKMKQSFIRPEIKLTVNDKFVPNLYCYYLEHLGQNRNYSYNCDFQYQSFFIRSQAILGKPDYQFLLKHLEMIYENIINNDEEQTTMQPIKIPDQNREAESISIHNNAELLWQNNISRILANINVQIDSMIEEKVNTDHQQLFLQGSSKSNVKALKQFISYGVDYNTAKLGTGERAAVVYSYFESYGKLPESEAEMEDVIRIANGRWPKKKNEPVEKKAKEIFRKIYKKIADINNLHDMNAIMVIAYGLRQPARNRNLDSERAALTTFRNIYSNNPAYTADWNVVQTIAYSGASRSIDSDKDFLPDDREIELSCDPNNPDSDFDGYIDGIEVENYYNPLGKN